STALLLRRIRATVSRQENSRRAANSRSLYGPVFTIATKKRLTRTWSAPGTTFFSCIHFACRYCENDFTARARTGAARDTMGGEKEERMTKKVTLAAATVGHAEGGTTLNAFDNALLAAGIGNINLVKISSILPPDVPVIELPKIKPGALVPTAYAAMTSDVPGETIAAAVGYAVPDDPAKNGVIMEFHGHATRAEAEEAIRGMLDEAFRVRGEAIKEMRI